MLDIGLVIIGIGLIIVSYVISDKLDKKKENGSSETAKVDVWSDKDEQRVKARIEEILADQTESVMIKTDDQLSQISNEKIMAVSEFSDQILEKIKQNHTEVVFLYDMLNEKDTQFKLLLQEIEQVRKKTEAVVVKTEVIVEKAEAVAEKTETVVKRAEAISKTSSKENNRIETAKTTKTAVDLLEQTTRAKAVATQKKAKSEETSTKKAAPAKGAKPVAEFGDNKNEQILQLYEEGNTIVEIAKILSMGQGEVKLVIDLFQGARGLV